jgi:hypothetical protein
MLAVALGIVMLSLPILASSCASGQSSSTALTIGTIDPNCQPTPTGCVKIPPTVTATTVPATYACDGRFQEVRNGGRVRIIVYPRAVAQNQFDFGVDESAEQVGACETWINMAFNPERAEVYIEPSIPESSVNLVAEWFRAQVKIIRKVEIVPPPHG